LKYARGLCLAFFCYQEHTPVVNYLFKKDEHRFKISVIGQHSA